MSFGWLAEVNAWSAGWAAAMLRASLHGGAAVLVGWTACHLFPGMPAVARCWVWRLVYLKLFVALLWAVPVDLPLLPAEPTAIATPVASSGPSLTHTPTPPYPQTAPATSPSFTTVLLALWMIGVIWCLVRVAGEWCAGEWLRGLCKPVQDDGMHGKLWELCRRFRFAREPRLLLAEGAGSPVLLGVSDPSVVVSSELLQQCTQDEVRLMLAHELAHLKRRDLQWGWVPALGHALFFFHPLQWLASREWRLAQEMACDELAVRVAEAPVGDYGSLLAKVAAQYRPNLQSRLVTAGVVESADALKERLKAMKRLARPVAAHAGLAAVVLGVLAVVGIVPWRLTSRAGADVLVRQPAAPADRSRKAQGEKPSPQPASVALRDLPEHRKAAGGRITTETTHASTRRTEVRWYRTPAPAAPAGRAALPQPALPAGPATARGPVEQALFDLDVSVPGNRKWIAGKLARMEPAPAYRERVAGALHPLLDDPDLFTRSAAANALGVWGTAESVPLLIERLEDREHSVRWATLEALGKLKDLRAAEPVAQLLHRGDRGFASQALQAMGPLAAPAAVRRLKDPEWTVRMEACRILKAVGSREQEPALREVLREDSGLVAMAAEEALRVILSRRPSPDP